MNVLHIMSPQVISVTPQSTVHEAIELMLKNRISGLPVVDNDENLIGIVSEGDFLRRVEIGADRKRNRWLHLLLGPGWLAGEYVHSHGRKIEEIMTREPVAVSESTSLEEAARLMEKKHIKRLPVTRGTKLVGIVTRANLIQAIAARGNTIPTLTVSDQEIRTLILNEIAKQPWAPVPLINVAVDNGMVQVFGVVSDGRQEQALKVLIENIRGVKAVKNELTWVNPISGAAILTADEQDNRKLFAR